MPNELVLTREQSRLVDSVAQENYALPGIILMENAGLRAADKIYELLQAKYAPPWSVAVLTGKGNNGGDGFVIARHLCNRGIPVRVFGVRLKDEDFAGQFEKSTLAGLGEQKKAKVVRKFGLEPPSPKSPADSLVNLRIIRRMGIAMMELGTDLPLEQLDAHFADTDVIVDALLGTGTRGAPREPYAEVIRRINSSSSTIVSIDLPSGLDANTGETPGECVRASVTITFVAKKTGFMTGNGPQMCGEIYVADISVPSKIVEGIARGSA